MYKNIRGKLNDIIFMLLQSISQNYKWKHGGEQTKPRNKGS